jgi:hypothetical protein
MNEPKITVAAYCELKRLVERAADRQERMAGDRGGWTDAKLSTSLYVGDVSELDEYSRQLEAKGITEEDIERRAALLADPDFREPAPLGHIVVDDVDLDYEVSEPEIDGLGFGD